jgi:hyperosmotically inducible protein
MKTKFVSSLFIIGAVLAPVAAYADKDAEGVRTQSVAFVKDSVITTKIKARLAEEKMSTLTHVSVDTDANGAVALSGHVKTREQADRAVAIARATEGATSVTSTIHVIKDE